ncbi:MAG TPA: ABC transporter permease, partial [Gemmataceae bacterium]|nr:ABC transporter permease [Gemmataceae bacterium]
AVPEVYRLWQEQVMRLPAAQVQRLPAAVHVPSVLLAFGVALSVGLLFGWYPSRRAARLDPIQALRHD